MRPLIDQRLDYPGEYPHNTVMEKRPSGPSFFYARDQFPRSGMPLSLVRARDHGPSAAHAHDFSELVVILAGRGMHLTSAGRYPIACGDVFVVQGDTRHGYEDAEDLQLVNIMFQPEPLGLPSWDITGLPGYHALFSLEPTLRRRHRFRSRLRLSMDSLEQVEELIRRLEEELNGKRAGYRYAAAGMFSQLVVYLSRCYTEMKQPEPRALLRIAETLSYMERHYAEKITMKDLVRIAHMSESSLLRTFRRALGVTPIAYLIHLRIRRAMDIMRNEGANVTEAAFRVGFSDSNYFSRQFRKVMGTSPRRFMKGA
jgi:AraC-like DNA-binding protein/quercetin dioxygenase-like cupin family protein